MEDSDLVSAEHISPDREWLEHRPLKQFAHGNLQKIYMEICRVCSRKSGRHMVNICDSLPELGVRIAEMISLVSGHHVSYRDNLPEIVCLPCLEDVTKAFKRKLFCQLKEDSQEEDDLLEQEVCKLSDSETETDTPQVDVRVKPERVDEDLLENEGPYLDVLTVPEKPLTGLEKRGFDKEHEDIDQCQVKNEPIEEDTSEEEDYQISEGEVYLSDCQVISEGSEYQSDSQRIHPPFLSKEPDLNEHILTNSGESLHKCSICEKIFIKNSNLQRHLRWHKDERTFKCSQCPKKTFLLKSNHERHLRTHTGERPYKCPQCEKSFSLITHLKVHTLSHTGKSPYQCSHCTRVFFGKQSLANHILMHTGERPFKCPHCPEDFTRKPSLQEHLRDHTRERPYKCDICQNSFSHKSNLTDHLFTHRAVWGD